MKRIGMMVVILASALCGGMVCGGVARAQAATQTSAPMPVATGTAAEVRRSYEAVKGNILKSAEKMPAEAYGYKPDPEVRTFARVLTHVIEAQVRSCGMVNGTAMDAMMKTPAETASKEAIVEALKASFAECDKAYGAATDASMLETRSMGKQTRTVNGFLWGNVSHDSEQYATLALYLRLKGMAPPSAEK